MNSPTNLVLVLLAIALFYVFTTPEYQEVKGLQATANEYKDVIDNVSKIAATRDALFSNYQALPQNEVERLNKVLPDKVDTVRFALDLDTIAGRYGIAIQDLDVNLEADPNAALAVLPDPFSIYEKATVTFNFVSSYPSFISFILDLEKNLRIMDITAVNFQVTDQGLYEHTITAVTYWLK